MATGRAKRSQAAHELLRRDLLDAAGELLVTHAWSDVTMEKIAAVAGVSRQTLYNEFGSRDSVAQSLVLRETEEFLVLIEQSLRSHPDDPHAAIESAFVTVIESAARNPLVRSIVVLDPQADDLLALFTTRGGLVMELCTGRLAEIAAELWPTDDRDLVSFAAEAITRLAISHVALPTRPTQEAARLLADMVAPLLVQEPDRLRSSSPLDAAPAAPVAAP